MKKLFKRLLLLLIALAVGIAVLLYNPGIIKGPLQRYLSELAGYSIILDGELAIETGRVIEISAKDLRVSGPDWASRKDLVAVGYLNLKLDTASIFKDTVIVESLQVDSLQLNLETDSEGHGNWLRANAPSSPPDKKSDGVRVVFKEVRSSDANFRFQNGKIGRENVLNLTSLIHHQQTDGMLHTTLKGKLNNRPVEYTQAVGPWSNLLSGRDISYKATGQFGELAMQGDALIDSLKEPRQPKLNLNMQGPNIDEITAMLGIEDLGGGGFSLRAKAALVNGSYEADINGKVGDISLKASGQSPSASDLNNLDLAVAINGPSLGAFTRVFGLENWPDKPFSLNGDAKRVGKTLNISDLTLDIGSTKLKLDALLTRFPDLDQGRIKLNASGDDFAQFRELIHTPGIASGPYELKGTLDVSPEGTGLLKIDFDSSLGKAMISGTLGSGPTYLGSKFDLHLDGYNANSVMSVFGMDVLPEQPFNLNAVLELVENGVQVERGVLATIKDERLELGGFVAFTSGGKGTDIDIRLSGKRLAQLLRPHAETVGFPDRPYDLSGQLKVLEEGVKLEKAEFTYEAITLKTDGLIKLNDGYAGTALDFRIQGEDLSALKSFQAIGDSLDIFVPGQSYQASGRFMIQKNDWNLQGVSGRIGKTDLSFDAQISRQPDRAGSNTRISAKGPDLNQLLVKMGETGLPGGVFESSAGISLSATTLSIKDFSLKTGTADAKIDLDLPWPVSSGKDAKFTVNIRGEDIRNFLPAIPSLEVEKTAFQLNASGNRRDKLLIFSQFDTAVGNLQASLKGEGVGRPEDGSAEMAFSISSENISKLGRWNGEQLPALALDIKADFKGDAEQFSLRNLVGSLGESRLNGELDVSLKGPKPDIRLTATSEYVDIRPFLDKKDPGNVTAPATKPDRLIPATPIPLGALAAADVKVSLRVTELRYVQDSITNLALEVEQQDGGLDIKQFSHEAPRGTVSATLSIHPSGANKADVKIDLTTKDLILNFSGMSEEKLKLVPAFDIGLHATGNGGNLREVAGAMNGSLYIGSKGGDSEYVDLSVLESFILDDIFAVLMPKSGKVKDNHLSCLATIMEISDGLMKTNPALALSSDRLAVISKGTLDLKTEKMNFDFNAIPSNALKIGTGEIFQPYILISGTLAKPKVGVDPAKVVLRGGTAIATLGVSVLAKGLIDRLGNAAPVCEQMLKKEPAVEKTNE